MERKTSNSKKASEDGKRLARKNKRLVLDNICQCIHEEVKSNNGRMPHGYMRTILEENKSAFEWLTRDIVNSAYCRFKRRVVASNHSDKQPVCEIHLDHMQKSSSMSDLSESQQNHSSISSRKNKGGRLLGSTNTSKRKRQDKIIAMKNDIIAEYIELKKRKRGRVSRGILDGIISRQKNVWFRRRKCSSFNDLSKGVTETPSCKSSSLLWPPVSSCSIG